MNSTVSNGESADLYSLLLVDDCDDDRLFIRRAFRAHRHFSVVAELRDGESAIEYLNGQGSFGDRDKYPYPDVLLLDLKMPRKTGHEVLEWLRCNRTRKICVVVLSGSCLPRDIARSRELGADAYFTKDALLEQQEAMITKIEEILAGSEFRGAGEEIKVWQAPAL